MTINKLVADLISFLSSKTATISLVDQNGNTRTPQYIEGYLPPKRSTDTDDFPYIIIRPSNGNDSKGDIGMVGELTVKILIGVYSEEIQGYQDAVSLLENIRLEVLRQRVISAQFDLQAFSWQFPEEQTYPQFWVEATTNWAVLVPHENNYLTGGQNGESYI